MCILVHLVFWLFVYFVCTDSPLSRLLNSFSCLSMKKKIERKTKQKYIDLHGNPKREKTMGRVG